MPDGLRIRLLGGLEVERDGELLPLPASKKTRALLAYLAVEAAPQSRQRLCELFWEGPVDPRAELRWSLSKLRSLVDTASALCLRAERERIALDLRPESVDVLARRLALAPGMTSVSTAVLESTGAQWHGEFLEGLELPDCHRFHQWLAARRESSRNEQAALLAELSARADPAEALRHARAWLAIEPLDERAHARVIVLLGRAGKQHEALAHYEACRRLLRNQLATRPSQVLEDARLSLTAHPEREASPRQEAGSKTPGRPLPAIPASEAGNGPFVGRTREMATFATVLEAAAVGRAQILLTLIGDPGMGKTRFLAEAARLAAGRGGRVLYGRAFEAEMVRPYGAWIDALRSIPLPPLDSPLRHALAPLLPELERALDGEPPVASSGTDRLGLFEAVVTLLADLGETGRPTLLLLDDLQWLDDASAALLHYAQRALAGRPVLILAAARPSEIALNPPLDRMLRALDREARLHRLELPPLDRASTAELLRSVGEGLDASGVFDESDGNPMYALEIARATERGSGLDSPTSDGLSRLLDERLSRLGADAQAALPWAAALGRSFAGDLLQTVSGMESVELLAATDELERHGIVRVADSGRYDFTHDLLRRSAYRQISPPRRQLLHRAIAERIEGLPDPDGALAGDLAHHAALGALPRLAAEAALRAGQRCLRIFALAEAAELAERGLRHAALLPRELAVPLQLELLRVSVESQLGRHDAVKLESEIERLTAEASGMHLASHVQIGTYLLAVLAEARGDSAGARDLTLRGAAASRDAGPATAAQALGNTGRCLAQIERDQGHAEELLLEAAELAERHGLQIIDIPWGFGLLRHFEGRHEEATQALEAAVQIARKVEDHWSESQCMTHLAMIEIERGRPDRALDRCAELSRIAAKLGEGSEAPIAAALAALAGRSLAPRDAEPVELAAVEATMEAALAGLRAVDTNRFLAYALNVIALHDLARGAPELATIRSEEALRAALASGRGHSSSIIAHSTLARAAAVTGDQPGAERHLVAAQAEAARPERLSGVAEKILAEASAAVTAASDRFSTISSTPAPTAQGDTTLRSQATKRRKP
ncbi:MAG: AAA family ATPase [Acidobacteriota bacterium]